ncbi:MAG TPA: VOC family protein [Pseudonocardiaceae bacterium]|nr:VOC family protein [Pseudonocardiaceae bacterium]
MPVQRLNHAVLYVRDVARSVEFYSAALGFRPITSMGELTGAAFLQAAGSTNDHDLGLFQIGADAEASPAGKTAVGLYHLGWEVDTLAELRRIADKLTELGALVGASDHATTKALYGKDPDGIEFEVCWLVPAHLLSEQMLAARKGVLPLNLAEEIATYGAATLGGVGVSVPA